MVEEPFTASARVYDLLYEAAGVDLAPAMLEEARHRLPGVPMIEGDMRSFALDRRFDAVTCLFSAIGYMRSCSELDEALQSMSDHLSPGGVLVVDGWVRRQSWRDPGTMQVLSSSRDGLGAARVAVSRREGTSTTLELHHLVGSIDGVEHLVEAHVMTLFSDDEYRDAFARARTRR